MAKRASTDHIVIDFAGPRPSVTFAPDEQLVSRCLHCGDRYVLGLPVSVTMAAVVMKQYTREHRHCKAPKTSHTEGDIASPIALGGEETGRAEPAPEKESGS